MAWNDIASIPWLAQNPTEVSTSAGLRGAQIGSMIARSWAQGQEGRRQDEQSQREAELQPLRIKAAQTQAQLQALQIANTLFERDMAVKAMTGVTKLSSVMEGITDWAAPETERAINQVLGAYPALDKTDAMAAARESIKIARKAKADILSAPFLTKAVDAAGNPTGVEVIQTAPNRFAQVRPGTSTATSATPAEKDIVKANEWLKEARAMELAGDSEGAKVKRDDALLLKEAHAKSGMTFTADGQGGFQLTQGGGKIPNMGVNTKVLERLSSSEKAIDGLDDLASTLRPGDVGIRGVVGELFLDKILPQFGAKTADIKRIDNRTKLRMLAEGLMRTVSFDTRFSDRDSLRIAKITPSPGMVETHEHTQQAIATIKTIFAKRALIDAKEAQVTPPPFAIRSLDDDALRESVEKGLLTMEQAKAEYDRRHPIP